MNTGENFHGTIICGLSFSLGMLFSASLLNEYGDSPVAQRVLEFGGWVSGMAGVTGKWPALLASSAICGLLAFCLIAAVLPRLEEWVAKLGMERSKKALQKEKGLSVEDEMEALVRRFGANKPS